MKIALLVARIFMGGMFIFASIAYFFPWFTPPPIEGNMKIFNDGLAAAAYLMPLVKTIELTCGILLLANRFVPLLMIILLPIIINILLVHAFLGPAGLPVAILLLVSDLMIAWSYRTVYQPLLKAKN